jgi:site-specific DNA-methyltransferase (adenine-specific)
MSAINLHNCDCMDFMRSLPDKAYQLAIVDPPYGIGEHGGKDRGNRVRQHNGTVLRVKHLGHANKGWDSEPPSPEYFAELQRVSVNQILWGANHYSDRLQRASSAWVIWDKVNGDNDFADCEMAWTSFGSASRLFPFMWNGMCQGSPSDGRKQQGNKALNEQRIHPTQKPVALYRWLLQHYAKPGDKILDTHGGSMSIAIACDIEGFDLDLCELDKDYFEAGKKRLEQHQAQPRMFEVKVEPQGEQLKIA